MAYESGKHQMTKITCSYEGPTLMGKPHGLGYLQYTEGTNDKDVYSFTAIALLDEGEIHGGPALFTRGDGSRFAYSFMYFGRP